MKKAQLLSVVFSLIMFTGVTAGTAVSYAESDDSDYDFDDRLEYFCEMTEVDQAAFLEKYPMASDHKDKLDEYCLLDESEREAYIEEHKDEYSRGHDYDIKTKLDKFCEMSTDELAALAEKHGKGEDHLADMEEYCSLDDAGRDVFIEEHKDEFTKVHDYDMREKINEFCEMSEEDRAGHLEKYQKSEEHLTDMEEFCSLDDAGQDAFIKEHKDSMGDKMSDHKDTMTNKMSDHKDSMGDKMSDHKNSMSSDSKPHTVLRASTLTDEQKNDIREMHSDLRDMKHSLRDKSIDDVTKQDIRDQFMEKAKEFSMTWLSPRHQVSAGIDAQMVECRENFALVMKTSNASPICVKETTAEKLIERGIAISAI